MPGTYDVRLTVDQVNLSRKIVVTNDPRSDATAADLSAQFAQEQRLSAGLAASRAAIDAILTMRSAARDSARQRPAVDAAVKSFDQAAAAVLTAMTGNRGLAGRLADLEFADLRPTPSTIASVDALCTRANGAFDRYREFIAKDLAALNAALTAAGASAIRGPATIPAQPCGR